MLAGGGHFLQHPVRKRSKAASSHATWHWASKQCFFSMNVNIDKELGEWSKSHTNMIPCSHLYCAEFCWVRTLRQSGDRKARVVGCGNISCCKLKDKSPGYEIHPFYGTETGEGCRKHRGQWIIHCPQGQHLLVTLTTFGNRWGV